MVTENILPANTNQALSIIRLKENDTILKEYYSHNDYRDSSVSYYKSGAIKEFGKYANKFKRKR